VPDHSCILCCESLGYLDHVIRFDMEQYRQLSRWYKIRHPYRALVIKIRSDHALDLFDESGK
jgi:hypothetical protein